MRHYVIKNTAEYRVETIEDVVAFREELQKQAAQDGYSLSAFSYSEKLVKERGEVVDNFYAVKAVFTVNDMKEPTIPIFDVELPYAAESMRSTSDDDSEDDMMIVGEYWTGFRSVTEMILTFPDNSFQTMNWHMVLRRPRQSKSIGPSV